MKKLIFFIVLGAIFTAIRYYWMVQDNSTNLIRAIILGYIIALIVITVPYTVRYLKKKG